MLRRIPPLAAFGALLLLVLLISSFGPAERSLGTHVRLVYLHGAWVWTSLIAFAASAVLGLAGLLIRRKAWQSASVALGQVGTFFWLTYLPMSLAVMQATWNGLFLEEPRFRIGLDFAVVAVFFQAAILIVRRADWGSAINVLFFAGLSFSLASARQIMHPPSPIASSGSLLIEAYFVLLVLGCLAAAWQLMRWLQPRAPGS